MTTDTTSLPSTLNLFQRLNAIMKTVRYVQKENKRVNNQYTFVSHDSVTAALHGPLAEHGVLMIPSVAELTQDGNRTAVKMELCFLNIDEPSERFVVFYWGYGIDPSDKGIGKAISYAVKYGLLKVFCLETGDDVEKDNIEYKPAAPVLEPEVAADLLKAKKKAMVAAVGKENAGLVKDYFDKLADITKKSATDLILGYKTVDEFSADFAKWKAKQDSKAAQPAQAASVPA